MFTIKATMTPKSPSRRLRTIQKQLEDRRELMQQSKAYMINRWNANFAGNGSIYGGWAANSEWKEGDGPMHGNTGALASYFQSANSAGIVTRDRVSWRFANDGSQFSATHSTSGISPNPLKGHKAVPRRVLWDMNGADQQKIVRMVEQWIGSKVVF